MNPNEDKSSNTPSDQPGIGPTPVMDVQPPQSSKVDTDQQSAAQSEDTSLAPSVPNPADQTAPESIDPSKTDTPQEPELSTDSSEQVLSPDSATEEQNQSTTMPTDEPTPTNPALTIKPEESKQKGHKLVIVITVLVVLVLAGVAIYVFMGSKNVADDKTSQLTNQVPETQQSQEVTPGDIDNLTAEIDTELSSLNDEQDFVSSELADNTLGL